MTSPNFLPELSLFTPSGADNLLELPLMQKAASYEEVAQWLVSVGIDGKKTGSVLDVKNSG